MCIFQNIFITPLPNKNMISLITLIIIGVFIALALAYFKFEHHGRKVKAIIIIFICALIYFSITGVLSSDQVDLTSPKGIIQGVYIYTGWMGQTISSLWNIGTDTVTTVGNAIKLNDTKKEKNPRR